jgi:hypothetical protein
MAAYTVLRAVHTVLEFRGGNVQVALPAERIIPGESLPAMTAQATVVAQFGIGWVSTDRRGESKLHEQQQDKNQHFFGGPAHSGHVTSYSIFMPTQALTGKQF